ncbi:phage portal protein [Maricaulis sp.]|jgi:HK97 family phage portal protein|uniref:phage portal protein n=1 Tax=Maricaulis sp. TaxID=1486257 RepID=UPI002610FD44|nr:phage portal protein [Maricaulis sp.]
MSNWLSGLLRRDVKTAVSSRLVSLAAGRGNGWRPRALPAQMQAGYARNAIANRCVRLIAEAAASLPFEASERAAQRLLNRPNADTSGPELWETLYGFLQLAGNAYLEVSSLDGAPRELFILRPDRMRVLADASGWPAGWEYSVAGGKRRFERDRATGRTPVFHMRLFHPGDDHYGLSPLEPAGRALDLHTASADWARSLVDNAARPSGALVFNGADGQLTGEQFERLKAELTGAHTGAANAGRPLLLEGGLDWKPMALSPAEMDFIEARREAAREIALAFGVPPLLLGLPGDNTYSNYREANQAFWRQTVLPLARKTARALEVWLQPWFGDGLGVAADERAVPREDVS